IFRVLRSRLFLVFLSNPPSTPHIYTLSLHDALPISLPHGTTGSLCSTFVPDRLVSLAVKLPYAIALYARLPSVLREPLEASVTLLEATTPVKLPTTQCPLHLQG